MTEAGRISRPAPHRKARVATEAGGWTNGGRRLDGGWTEAGGWTDDSASAGSNGERFLTEVEGSWAEVDGGWTEVDGGWKDCSASAGSNGERRDGVYTEMGRRLELGRRLDGVCAATAAGGWTESAPRLDGGWTDRSASRGSKGERRDGGWAGLRLEG